MKFRYFIVFLSLIGIVSCTEANDMNELIIFDNEDLKIELLSVEDSRCPIDVSCVWAGDALIHMSVRSNDDTAEFKLNSNPTVDGAITEVELFGYLITLIDISPEPKSTNEIELEDYVINLDVQKI